MFLILLLALLPFFLLLMKIVQRIKMIEVLFFCLLHLIPAQPGNRIITMCVGDVKPLIILVSCSLTLVKVGCAVCKQLVCQGIAFHLSN